MQLTLSLGLEDLAALPVEMRQKIQQALQLPAAASITYVQVPEPVPPQSFTVVPPVVLTPPPVVQMPVWAQPVPVKEPQIIGNTKVYLADRGHITQQSSAVDVLTGQPVQIAPPSGPVIPQIQNAPVNVTPVTTTGPVVMQPVPGVDVSFVRAAALRLYGSPELGGKNTLDACMARIGMNGMASLSEQNAGPLYQQILNVGGK